MMRVVAGAGLVAFLTFASGAPSAAAGTAVSVTGTTVVFTVADLTTPSVSSAPVTVAASITFTTTPGGAGGSVFVNPSVLASNPAGDTLDPRNFTVTCVRTSGSAGFVALAPAMLNGATRCATLTQGFSGVTANFTIQLRLNDTPAAPVPFGAARFGPAPFTVTANAT